MDLPLVVAEPKTVRRLIGTCRAVLGMSQGELGDALGVSRRTIIRWQRGHTYPVPAQALQLADLVREEDDDLADELIAAIGIDEPTQPEADIAQPAVASEAVVTSPAPPPEPTGPAPVHAIDSIVCVAADAASLVPRAMRPALLAAFTRAMEMGYTLEQVVRGMKPQA
jgi:DNA-binding XRE family transcriptional regulator